MSQTRLLFVHGRSQEHKDAVKLKGEWVDAFRAGLAKSGLTLPLSDTDIRFPYYGQTLHDLVTDAHDVADVVVRGGTAADDAEQRFQQAVLQEVQEAKGITDLQVEQALASDVRQRGPLKWEWVQGILKAIDQHLPGVSAATLALVTRDVYQYLKNPPVRDVIDRGVREAMEPGVPTVVVSHSLGTVVAFNLLRRDGEQQGWRVPLLVTLGSPLGVKAIKAALAPIEFPACATRWFNAMDERDVVALYPLTPGRFDVDPAIENKTNVRNRTSNSHGISGYLDDAEVARRIHAAL